MYLHTALELLSRQLLDLDPGNKSILGVNWNTVFFDSENTQEAAFLQYSEHVPNTHKCSSQQWRSISSAPWCSHTCRQADNDVPPG